MQKRYIVRLTEEEREICRDVIRRLKGSSERVRRAQVLLQADADGPGWTDREIAAAFSCRVKTVENIRQRCVLEGFDKALERKQARHATDAEDSRRRVRGADHRLASRATAEGVRELEFAVAGASRGRVGDCRVGEPRNAATDAKKNGMCQRKIAYWVIPPDADAEFAAHMEEVLETYARPLDCDCPVLCMDEQPVQLIRETRTPMPATRNRPRRVDYEYERAGTASVFMFCEPLSGWRQATARPRRTKSDWAEEVAGLLEGRYAACSQIVVVCDNLNTHTKGAFYERFEPQRARALVRRIVFCYTPKHGSWLNIAECELSAMTRQCLNGRRLGDLKTLCSEIAAWSTDVNRRQRGVDWQMDIDDARRKTEIHLS